MIDFLSINFTLRLFNLPTDGRSAEMPLLIQYFHFEAQAWTTLYEITTIKGGVNFRRMASEVDSANEIETYFFNTVRTGYTPHIRILPGAGATIPEGLSKDLVVSSNYSFGLNPFLEAYEFDFGSLYFGTDEQITEIAPTFKEFIPMSTFFPLVEKPESVPVPINELYTNIVSEIVVASDTGIDSPYKLSNISLKLKALIHEDGGSMSATLLDLENSENVNEAAISELLFDITPVDHRQNTTAVMPNCVGLTETAVRRILKNAGLRLNPVYQKIDTVVNGDSFKQSPLKGTAVQPNQLVTVIFSKHE